MRHGCWVAGLCVVVLAGCGGRSSVERGNMLMALAAQEAGKIQHPSERLTRQLNIAEMQSGRGQHDNASKTLTAAKETIFSAGDALTDRVAMAGYVSISQLARRAGDTPLATAACGDATNKLQSISPPEARVPYVRSLAMEINQLHGPKTAAKFTRDAGPWCKAIDDASDRRTAIFLLTNLLFQYDDDSGGLAMLQQEDDPAWRTDRLTDMANANFRQANKDPSPWRGLQSPVLEANRAPASGLATDEAAGEAGKRKSSYSQQIDLDYGRNFQNRQLPAE